MLPKLRLPISAWLLLAAALLFLLQYFWITGIFLMMLGAVYVNGALVVLALFVLLLEAIFGRISPCPSWDAAS